MDLRYPIKSFSKDKARILQDIRLATGSLNLISSFFDFVAYFDDNFISRVDECNEIHDYFKRLYEVVDKLEYSELMSSEKPEGVKISSLSNRPAES